ncbi:MULTISPECIES: S8 family serine peptidase [unclassified Bacillus (in: firmicutes)]|uniref:S8 family peptidase n=1 Tax=unclassified Bacillus (in: firmicutes) TaxID=185979 RepID=UPI000BEF7643|nr:MULTISPECIES: S8 family serine peptidase [unclassified Bacillus (in: firmicutes)]PEJ57618.1 hypothetical protein CN692_12065 [Bacillus sp. AFS002410]PEL08387.1 hypothetical protein CN601_16845 [Bacillus sp. AFS017336]
MSSIKKSLIIPTICLQLALIPSLVLGQTTEQTDISGIKPVDSEKGQATNIKTVTLLTGDKVEVTTALDGNLSLNVQPAPGREGVNFYESVTRDKTGKQNATVIPMDAVPLVDSKALDERLFDIDQLIADGYTNEKSDSLPLIVGYKDDAAVSSSDPSSLGALNIDRNLPSLHGFAADVDHDEAAKLWKQLTTGSSTLTLDNNVKKVWLDGKVHIEDVEANNLIGSPTVWASGYTGKGATVAILDSGYDATHPDLAGRVIEAKDFTDTNGVAKDTLGHGTHVASIIAGTGAASDGMYRGVAPDTSLLIGKVCTNSSCEESDIVAGMEWASSKHPAAINMSLGGDPSDGTDSISQAVNRLTEQTGTLFVISAGNSGAPFTVGNPGSADAALTVASSTKTDTLSTYSSQGPRVGDLALKPDITAPGQAIIAARAAGTNAGSPIDSMYTNMSGTSMAAPHVTGAVAIMKQLHPDWTATQLKAALMSSAKPLSGVSVYGQGAGRLDLVRATNTNVYATSGSVSLGFPFPHSSEKVNRTVTYRNDSATDVTLELKTNVAGPDGKSAPDGMFNFSSSKVTVPAKGTASLEVTVDPSKVGKLGAYSGYLTATAGETSVNTAIGAYFDIEAYPLTVRTIDRNGNAPTSVRGIAFNSDTGENFQLNFSDGVSNQRLPVGHYDFNTFIESVDSKGHRKATIATRPDFLVSKNGNKNVILDARTALPITVKVDKDNAGRVHAEVFHKSQIISDEGNNISSSRQAFVATYGNDTEFFATPTVKVADPVHHIYQFAYRPTLVPRDANGKVPMYTANGWFYNLVFHSEGNIPADLSFQVRDKDLAQVHTTYHDQGKVEKFFRTEQSLLPGGGGLGNKHQFVDAAPLADRIEYYTADKDISWLGMIVLNSVTNGVTGQGVTYDTRIMKKGKSEVEWNRGPVNPSTASTFGGLELFPSRRTGDTISFGHRLFSFGEEGHELTEYTGASKLTGTTAVTRTGGSSGSVASPVGITVIVPADDSEYTVTTTATRQVGWSDLGTQAETTWTFHSKRPAGGETTLLPLLMIRADGDFYGADAVTRRDTDFILNLDVNREDGAKVKLTKLSVEISFDDGKTWSQNPIFAQTIDSGKTIINHTSGGFVSLRLKAEDKSGNKVSQTMIRAFRIPSYK